MGLGPTLPWRHHGLANRGLPVFVYTKTTRKMRTRMQELPCVTEHVPRQVSVSGTVLTSQELGSLRGVCQLSSLQKSGHLNTQNEGPAPTPTSPGAPWVKQSFG